MMCCSFDGWFWRSRRPSNNAKRFKDKEGIPNGVPCHRAPISWPRINITQLPLLSVPNSPISTLLPLEIRQDIFERTLGGNNLHLIRTPGKIVCSRKRRRLWKFGYPLPKFFTMDFDVVNLSLLRTCRQVYNKAADFVYSSNVFVFEDPATLVFLRDYYCSPRKIAAIKHMEMQWTWNHLGSRDPIWERFWKLAAFEMKLKSLKICCEPRGGLTTTALWAKPMLEVHGIQDFHIELRLFGPVTAEKEDLRIRLENIVTTSMLRAK